MIWFTIIRSYCWLDVKVNQNRTAPVFILVTKLQIGEASQPSGRASDSRARGRGFNPHSGHRVVSLSKIHLPSKKVLVIPRMWLRSDMTEKLLTGTLNLNKTKKFLYKATEHEI